MRHVAEKWVKPETKTSAKHQVPTIFYMALSKTMIWTFNWSLLYPLEFALNWQFGISIAGLRTHTHHKPQWWFIIGMKKVKGVNHEVKSDTIFLDDDGAVLVM